MQQSDISRRNSETDTAIQTDDVLLRSPEVPGGAVCESSPGLCYDCGTAPDGC